MKCIDLVEEMEGIVSIGGCTLGEEVRISKIKLSQLSNRIKEKDGSLECEMGVTTMKYGQHIDDKNFFWSKIVCHYDYNQDDIFPERSKVREIEYHMFFNYGYPYITIADFEEKVDEWGNTKHFKNLNFEVHPSLKFNEIYLEGKKSEIELQWSKKADNKTMYILLKVLPSIYPENSDVFNSSAAIKKSMKKLALILGKDINDLNDNEFEQACSMCGIPAHDLDIP